MAKKKSKATKKFEKNNLKDTVDRRREFAKIKQRHQVKTKKKERIEKRNEQTDQNEEDGSSASENGAVENMNEDRFFQDVVPVPEAAASKKAGSKRKRQEDNNIEHGDNHSVGEETDAADEDDFGDHKGQLDALAQKDPEFYKYLKENDADLLDFDDEGNFSDADALSDDEAAPPTKKQKTKAQDSLVPSADVTLTMIEQWKASLEEQNSIRALRQVILAFRAAAHSDEEEKKDYKYTIPNSDVYHEVLMTALKVVPKVIAYHIPVKESMAGKLRIPTDSPKFKTLSPMVKSHVSSLHHLLGHLSDAATIKLTLQSFEPLLPYLLQFRKFLKVIVRSIASIWSDNSSEETTRITAFLNLRRLMVIGDPGIRETVLKSVYEGVVKGSRNTTIHTLPGINLMKNSAAEIWGIDQKVSYTTGFTFIRQLAIHLRGNITKPTKDSYKTIYNWQFVHSLDFWSRVLSTHCNSLLEAETGKESLLRPLIYPVVQITIGVMRLIPTPAYFPLRFQLMRSLLRISQATGTYIPLSAALLEVLNSNELKKPAKPSTSRPLDFDSNIRCPSSYLKTRVYQDGLAEQIIELFSEFFVLWTKSIAFPELQLPVVVMLKRWLRTASHPRQGNKNSKINHSILLLVQKSEANAKWILERRNQVNFAPKDRSQVQAFLKDMEWTKTPLGAYVVTLRNVRDQNKKTLEKGRREEDKRNAKQKKKNNVIGEVDGDEEDEEIELV